MDYLSSVHKLLGFIVINTVYFQKRVWLAEEILQKQRKYNIKKNYTEASLLPNKQALLFRG